MIYQTYLNTQIDKCPTSCYYLTVPVHSPCLPLDVNRYPSYQLPVYSDYRQYTGQLGVCRIAQLVTTRLWLRVQTHAGYVVYG